MSINNKEISTWSNEEVVNCLKELNLHNCIDSFSNNGITGYDLCYLSNTEMKEELRINRFHDRCTLLKFVREELLNQLRISVKFEDKFCEIQLDFEKKTNIDALITLVREVFKIQNENAILISTNTGEILSKNCIIGEMVLINSNKYRDLIVTTEYKKINTYYNNSDLTNQAIDPLKKTNSSGLGNYSNKLDINESKYKKYNEIPGITNNYNLPNDNFGGAKDYKYDFKYNKGNENFSTIPQSSSKLNTSIENKKETKYDSTYNDKYSNNENYITSKEPKFMAITDDYKVDNSLEMDKNSSKKYDYLNNFNKYNFKSGLDRNYENKNELQDCLNEKDSFYEKEFSSFSNNKMKNYGNYNDELLTPKDSNFSNGLKYETNSQKHSPLRTNPPNPINDKKYDNKYDYLGGDKDKSSKDRYFSSEKRPFRNGEKDKERLDKFESNNSLTSGTNNILTNNNNLEDRDYFKGLGTNPPKPNQNKPSFDENASYKSSIPSDLKYKIDSMRSEFNENIKKFQDPKKLNENNLVMKQNSNSSLNNLPTDKKLNRNSSGSDKKK